MMAASASPAIPTTLGSSLAASPSGACQCASCKAVFTVLPHFVLRYRRMSPDVARQALMATHGGLSLEWCATICHLSPMALYRLICALGQHSLVTVLVTCRLPLPAYILADEKHSKCLTEESIRPPSSVAGSSGTWATVTPKARWLLRTSDSFLKMDIRAAHEWSRLKAACL
ncbi:MAG TPA: hypothetical protein VLQ80_29845 [Candidatus Saccharimonadia bacterium]|nr:hypothetical protein [Candidatus Saccharimonadia bacterium]